MNEKTILIIDEDQQLREWLRSALVERGASVSTAPNGDEGLRKFYGMLPDLVLMEGQLRERTGMDVLREIRLLTDVPVVMVCADDGNPGIVRYLDAGADDYIIKPFERRVLMARIRALFRRARWQRRRAQGLIYDDGCLVIDLPAFRATLNGNQVKLSATEFALLVHLARRAGELCAYDEILADIWGEAFVRNPEYVHAYIWQLRQKIEQNPKKPLYLKSVRGVGYRFVAQLGPTERPRANGTARIAHGTATD